jgi:hypothetical protein
MKVRFTLSIGYGNAGRQEDFDYPDGTPDEEIERDYQDWQSNFLDGGWWAINKDGEEI